MMEEEQQQGGMQSDAAAHRDVMDGQARVILDESGLFGPRLEIRLGSREDFVLLCLIHVGEILVIGLDRPQINKIVSLAGFPLREDLRGRGKSGGEASRNENREPILEDQDGLPDRPGIRNVEFLTSLELSPFWTPSSAPISKPPSESNITPKSSRLVGGIKKAPKAWCRPPPPPEASVSVANCVASTSHLRGQQQCSEEGRGF